MSFDKMRFFNPKTNSPRDLSVLNVLAGNFWGTS